MLWGCACASPRGLGSWGSSLASVSCSLKTVCPGKLVTFLLWGRYLGTEGSLYCVGSSSGCLPCPAALRPLPGWSVSAAGHWFRAPVLGGAWAVSLWVLSTPAHGALSFVLLHFCRFDAGVTHTGLSCPGPWYEVERLTGQNHRHKLEPRVPFPHQRPAWGVGRRLCVCSLAPQSGDPAELAGFSGTFSWRGVWVGCWPFLCPETGPLYPPSHCHGRHIQPPTQPEGQVSEPHGVASVLTPGAQETTLPKVGSGLSVPWCGFIPLEVVCGTELMMVWMGLRAQLPGKACGCPGSTIWRRCPSPEVAGSGGKVTTSSPLSASVSVSEPSTG